MSHSLLPLGELDRLHNMTVYITSASKFIAPTETSLPTDYYHPFLDSSKIPQNQHVQTEIFISSRKEDTPAMFHSSVKGALINQVMQPANLGVILETPHSLYPIRYQICRVYFLNTTSWVHPLLSASTSTPRCSYHHLSPRPREQPSNWSIHGHVLLHPFSILRSDRGFQNAYLGISLAV